MFHNQLKAESKTVGQAERGSSNSRDRGELLGLEEVYIAILKRLDHVRREVGQPQVVVDEAGEGDVRGRFTIENVAGLHGHSQQVLTLPLAGALAFHIRGGAALSVSGSPQQSHQLFVSTQDEAGQRQAQIVIDRADSRRRSERIGFALSSDSSQSLKTTLTADGVTQALTSHLR